MSTLEVEVEEVRGMLARERLAIDRPQASHTNFLTHLGASSTLTPGPWIMHRQLAAALALSSLTAEQKVALSRAVIVDYGREFGVGRLRLEAYASGLPLGGCSLFLQPRRGGLGCLYTWGLGEDPQPVECDWLLLRAAPEWACDTPAKALSVKGLATLTALGGKTLLFVDTAVTARQISEAIGDRFAVHAHPRFLPHLLSHHADASVIFWPQEGRSAALLRKEFQTVAFVSAAEAVRERVLQWAQERPGVDFLDATCPGRLGRDGLARYWNDCGRPKIVLRGDPEWAGQGARWLRSLGAQVSAQSEATQLGLF